MNIWSDLYSNDLSLHATSPDSIGTIWFEDSDAESKVLSYLESLTTAASSSSSSSPSSTSSSTTESRRPRLDKSTTSFLDLGTGNGHMLIQLREEGGFSGVMVGIDYAAEGVELARRIAAQKGMDGDVRFESWDIMAAPDISSARINGGGHGRPDDGAALEPAAKAIGGGGGGGAVGELPDWVPSGQRENGTGFDVLLDKGTFDAISLSGDTDAHGRRLCEGYAKKVKCLMRKGGILIVTSCNWTEGELKRWFEESETVDITSHEEQPSQLVMFGRIGYRQFGFGGQVGQTVSSVVFRREDR
ncbi:MAG: hypothetical protein M1837_004069 [Sclerophora amabilis]|nr:MAG: hypothetical protein M1837_004069 [Sclerophora amabilis]